MASKTAIEAHLRLGLRELRYPVVASWGISNAPLGISRLVENIVLWRDQDGRVHALEDRCPHRSARLSMGWNLGERIACWYHGTEVDVISPPDAREQEFLHAQDAGQRASGSGKIVMLAAATAPRSAPHLLADVASNGAVLAMTPSMPRELGADGICVKAIVPGPTRCDATEYVPVDRHALYQNGRNLSRAQIPADIDAPVLHLLDLPDFVSRQTLPLNGRVVFN